MQHSDNKYKHPVMKIFRLFGGYRQIITSMYIFAFFSGLIQLSLPLGIQSVISFALGNTVSTSLVILIGLVIIGVLANGVVQVNQMKLTEKLQQELFTRYALAYAEYLPKTDLTKSNVYLPHQVNHFFDIISVQKGMRKLLLEIPLASIEILFGLLVLCFYHVAFIAFGLFLLFVLVLVMRYSGYKGLETSIKESDFKYKVAAWLEEISRSISAFKFSPSSVLNLKKTDDLTVGYLEARTAHFKILVFQYWWLIILKVLLTAVMFIVGSYLLLRQQLSIGQFIAAEILILTVINAVEKFIVNLETIYDTLTAVNKLEKLLDLPKETEGTIILEPLTTGISIRAENLSYHNGSKEIISNLSFDIPAGAKVAITGPGMGGKSTLLRIIAGKFRNYSGKLLINDLPAAAYSFESLRGQTGVLLNDHEIFEGTLYENLLEGVNNMPVTEVMRLSRHLGLSHLIEETPEGLQVQLLSDGKNIAQSEVQKILLLRNLVKQPRMLLLDNPFIDLDAGERQKVVGFIMNNLNGATLITVTHDTDFMKNCDIIYCLENGRLEKIAL